jgi:hypothetical protein
MVMNPLRLLISGYALAALPGAALWGAGAPLAGLAVVWLGGAVAVLALAALPWTRAAFRAAEPADAAGTDHLADLEAWERDRALDAARSAQERMTGTG